MRLTKWIFFAYLAAVLLLMAGIGISTALTPPRDPQTLYTTYSDNIKSMDPAEVNDTLSSGIIGNIFECLYNYKYGVQPYDLFPELAAAEPQFSQDGKTVTIKLRRGVRFYDPENKVFPDGMGPEVKAADVVYSWKRLANFRLASANYALVQGKIDGLDEFWEYTKALPADKKIDWERPVSGLTAVDDYTVRIGLAEPFPQLRYIMAYGPTAVVCRQAVEFWGDRIGKHPVGTGPYFLKEHLEEQRIVLEANPIYRGRPDIGGDAEIPSAERLPRIRRLQIDYLAEAMPAWMLFQQGLFDITGIPKETYGQAISMRTGDLTDEMTRKGIRLRKSPEAATYYVGFNMADPVVGRNKPLRQAMSMAFNRDEYIRIYQNGRGQPAIGPIPPGFPTFDPKRANPYTRFDLAAANKKMEEARRINGGPIPPLKILVGATDTSARQSTEFFVSQMARLGVQVVPDYTTWARFQDMVDKRQTQIFSLGWVADYPDEQDFYQLFYGKNADPSGINPCAYRNAEFDAIYDKAVIMQPSPQRNALYRRMEEIVMEDCPWLLQYYPVDYTLYYDWVKNYQFMDYGYGMRQFQDLDVQERRRMSAQY